MPQDYRGRLPAAESWRTYRAEEEEEGGREAGPHDDVLALMDGATASLRSVDPDAVQSGEKPAP